MDVVGLSQLHFEIIAPSEIICGAVFIICPTFFFFAKIFIVLESPSRHVNDILSFRILLQQGKN